MTEQSEYFVELYSFDDMARFACAFREYPRRIYSQMYGDTRVLSSTVTLANTLLVFYSSMPKEGRYVSYSISSGDESCGIADSTQNISNYAPIIHAESKISSIPEASDNVRDRFHPIKIRDLGSLARLTYDPEFPDEQDLTLYLISSKDSWILGYVTSLEMDDIHYNFNYVELDSEPSQHFLKYRGSQGRDPAFSNTFDHGFSYMPIIRIKGAHSIFGF